MSFCTHARNLLEFFFRSRKLSYALTTDYATQPYKKLDPKRPDVERLYGQLCAQINHLTYDRTDDNSKKVLPRDRELIEIVYAETSRLEKHLLPGFDKKYLLLNLLARQRR